MRSSTVVKNAGNPSSNPPQFHRLERMLKIIPVDNFKLFLLKRIFISTVWHLVTTNPGHIKYWHLNLSKKRQIGFKSAPILSVKDIEETFPIDVFFFSNLFAKKSIQFNSLPLGKPKSIAYHEILSKVVQNAINPGSNPLQFHRLVIVAKKTSHRWCS